MFLERQTLGAPEQIHENDDPRLAVAGCKDGTEPGEGPVRHFQRFARLPFHDVGRAVLAAFETQTVDETVRQRRRLEPEANQTDHALRRADGRGVLPSQIELREEIAREEGRADPLRLAADAFAFADQRQVAGVSLALEVHEGGLFLPGFGMDGVPAGHQ